ncbi:unnamed protein product [Ceratitis capitata]|uniref:(Mediterranean fruit fly) hypothetical protein n=1 Tax=Ceratitis capitata TaxID=7213 RepID=A0A811UP00_CERCA|nr:unnamed protein product [Ceratitis capitata]
MSANTCKKEKEKKNKKKRKKLYSAVERLICLYTCCMAIRRIQEGKQANTATIVKTLHAISSLHWQIFRERERGREREKHIAAAGNNMQHAAFNNTQHSSQVYLYVHIVHTCMSVCNALWQHKL